MSEEPDLRSLPLRLAKEAEITEIKALVNTAYRGEQGWTRETEIVAGDRVDDEAIFGLLKAPDSRLLVASFGVRIIATVLLQKKQDAVYIGLLSVHPDHQQQGLGKALLAQAEAQANRYMAPTRYCMWVVSQRPELIAFYERRGYVRTGESSPYPEDMSVGVPRLSGLSLEIMEKRND